MHAGMYPRCHSEDVVDLVVEDSLLTNGNLQFTMEHIQMFFIRYFLKSGSAQGSQRRSVISTVHQGATLLVV